MDEIDEVSVLLIPSWLGAMAVVATYAWYLQRRYVNGRALSIEVRRHLVRDEGLNAVRLVEAGLDNPMCGALRAVLEACKAGYPKQVDTRVGYRANAIGPATRQRDVHDALEVEYTAAFERRIQLIPRQSAIVAALWIASLWVVSLSEGRFVVLASIASAFALAVFGYGARLDYLTVRDGRRLFRDLADEFVRIVDVANAFSVRVHPDY